MLKPIQITSLKEQLVTSSHSLSEKVAEVTKLSGVVAELETKVQALLADREQVDAKIAEHEANAKELSAKVETAARDLDGHASRNAELEASVATLSASLETANSASQSRVCPNPSSSVRHLHLLQVTELESLLEGAQTALANLEKEKIGLVDKLSSLETSHSDVQGEKAETAAKLTETQQQLDAATREVRTVPDFSVVETDTMFPDRKLDGDSGSREESSGGGGKQGDQRLRRRQSTIPTVDGCTRTDQST